LDTDPTFGVFFMTKYDEATRCRIVEAYLAGSGGTKDLAKRHGVGRSTLRRWIAAYQAHGERGLGKKHSVYDAEFKLRVLQYMRSNELSGQQVSAIFDLRDATAISRWERQYHQGGYEALKPRPKGRRPKMPDAKPTPTQDANRPTDERSRQELLDENEYLRAEVAYLKKLQELRRAQALAAKRPKPRKS
jgi:transposase